VGQLVAPGGGLTVPAGESLVAPSPFIVLARSWALCGGVTVADVAAGPCGAP
jgi:hypothetical protein